MRTSESMTTTTNDSTRNESLGAGAKAAIVVGSLMLAKAVIFAWLFVRRRRKRLSQPEPSIPPETVAKHVTDSEWLTICAELGSSERFEMDISEVLEMRAGKLAHELEVIEVSELQGDKLAHELR